MKIPDRLCSESGSAHFNRALLMLKPIVKINGVDCEGTCLEYCVSGGWARIFVKNADGTFQRNVLGSGNRVKRVYGIIEVSIPNASI